MKLSAGGAIIIFFLSLFAFVKLVGPIPLVSAVSPQKNQTFLL